MYGIRLTKSHQEADLESWSPALRRRVIDALLALPFSDDPAIRDQVLAGVDRNLQIIVKRHAAPKIDFCNMVDAARSWGKRALTQLLESAIEVAPRSASALQLGEVLESLNAGTDANQVGANQLLTQAEVHVKQAEELPDRKPDITGPPSVPKIFVSYSHKDSKWLDQLEEFLSPLVNQGQFSLWSDTTIGPGDEWKDNIEVALRQATVAILLVTPHFLASEYIMNVELPAILRAVKEGKITLFWIAVSSSLYKRTPLMVHQAANDPSKPLDSLKPAARARVWVKISEKLASAVAASTRNLS